MNNTATSIVTVITILALTCFSGYMNYKLREIKPMIGARIIKAVLSRSIEPLSSIENKAFCLFYIMSLACYAKVFALLRQFRIGRMYIKIEWGFWSDLTLWILTPLFIFLIISHYENKLKNK